MNTSMLSIELLYTIYVILLGSGALYLILHYFYSKRHSQKSLFRKPINYIEIRTWRER